MGKNRLLEKQYSITITRFRDKEKRSRQELDIMPELVYENSRA